MTAVKELLSLCIKEKLKISTAESCTGGMLSAVITDVPGASEVFDSGFVTYSNEAKIKMLGVSESLLQEKGAVSFEVAEAMAEGTIANSSADISVSITGVAGPTGGTEDKPVGLVYIGCASKGEKTEVGQYNFSGDRASIRMQSVKIALDSLCKIAAMRNKND